jgi:hypothetical protein
MISKNILDEAFYYFISSSENGLWGKKLKEAFVR